MKKELKNLRNLGKLFTEQGMAGLDFVSMNIGYDGKVYFLIVEGRDAGSLGCSMDDMADIYTELGCVDAGTLDGGYSTALMLGDEKVYCSYHYGTSRAMPTVFYVKQLGDQ